MGRKSRLKRERREAKLKEKMLQNIMLNSPTSNKSSGFNKRCRRLKDLFAQYSAKDVIVSLCVSDLWLPNISSQVKHTLAFSVVISMSIEDFQSKWSIESYKDFEKFSKKLYHILPNFPMLEDYMPEADWGEIKYLSDNSLLDIFYGGFIERTPDFITAFELLHSSDSQANKDMHIALQTQHYILTTIEKNIVGAIDNVDIGHVETPSKSFWDKCRNRILSLSNKIEFNTVSSDLVTQLGSHSLPQQEMDFANDLQSGQALSEFLINIEGCYFPLSLRNSASMVIKHWANQQSAVSTKNISNFIAARFLKVTEGLFNIVTPNEILPYIFSSLIFDDDKPILVIALKESDLSKISKIESDMNRVLASGVWGMKPIHRQEMIRIQMNNNSSCNSPNSPKKLTILVVLSKVTTVMEFLDIPKTQAQILSLPDFVTLLDSVENAEELNRYWQFIKSQPSIMGGGIIGPVDQFAAFRDTSAMLIDGAIQPTTMFLDPRWGTLWRYQELTKYWDNSPIHFPRINRNTVWDVEKDQLDLYRLQAKGCAALSWCASVNNSVINFALEVDAQPIKADDGRILALLTNCIADAISQRQMVISGLSLFQYKNITTICRVRMDSLISSETIDCSDEALFSDWTILESQSNQYITAMTKVNLSHVVKYLNSPKDASFEVSATVDWLKGITTKLELSNDTNIVKALNNTSKRQPRFTLSIEERSVDVPDFSDPYIPKEEHYKIARRDLAIVFKNIEAKEGRYELSEAKRFIDKARDEFRILIHNRISSLSQDELTEFAIKQIDAITSKYDRQQKRIKMSLSHEVNYDRSQGLADAHEEFVSNARNYRYLLEASLSMPMPSGDNKVSTEVVIQLVASIDWLMVLYSVGDTLHHRLDVAGVELDQFYVPEVFYKEMTGQNQEDFSNEAANNKLGFGLNTDDEVYGITSSDSEWNRLNQAFEKDTEISIDQFLACLWVLYHWASVNQKDLHLIYSSKKSHIHEVLINNVENLTVKKAEAALHLITINPNKIRQLLGKSENEGDVPLWEHNKRGDRYTIKPIVQSKNTLYWGAASVEKASIIWKQTLCNGYMPANYDWPNVKQVVRKIKVKLEKQLERNAAEVSLRATSYSIRGIDFMRRFRSEKFDDVGDFDGLAYWPELNTWVTVECKYNQPAFCLKDARRLRDRIFGQQKKAHIPKIQKRTAFLNNEMERIRNLLQWPESITKQPPTIHELYVSRDIYWWMRNPPYSIQTQFVRVDALDQWLRTNIDLASELKD